MILLFDKSPRKCILITDIFHVVTGTGTVTTIEGCQCTRPRDNPSADSVLFFHIGHDVGNIAFQQPAQFIDGMGRNVLSPLHCVVIGLGKAHFEQSIGSNSLLPHGLKQWLEANHNTASITQTILCMCGIAYLRKKTYNWEQRYSRGGDLYARSGRNPHPQLPRGAVPLQRGKPGV